jgi:hypothetical protein
LHSGRIQDYYWKQHFGCGGQEYISGKPFLDKLGNKPAVVQVNMGKEEMLYLVWRNGESLPVSVRVVPFLKQSAIDKDFHSASIQKVA